MPRGKKTEADFVHLAAYFNDAGEERTIAAGDLRQCRAAIHEHAAWKRRQRKGCRPRLNSAAGYVIRLWPPGGRLALKYADDGSDKPYRTVEAYAAGGRAEKVAAWENPLNPLAEKP